MALYIVSSNYSTRYYKIERTKLSRNELQSELKNKTIHYYKMTDDEILAHQYAKTMIEPQKVNSEEVYIESLSNLTNVCNLAIDEVQKGDYMDVDCVGNFLFVRDDNNSPKKYWCQKCPQKFSYYGQAEDHFKQEHNGAGVGINSRIGINTTPIGISTTPISNKNSIFHNSIFKV